MQSDAGDEGSKTVTVRDPFRARHRKTGAAKQVGSIKPRLARAGYIRFLTIADLDGRSRAAMRTKELVRAIEQDLGGSDRLSTAQRQLVQRASLLAILLEDFEVRFALGQRIELQDYLATINCQRRVFEAIGLERRQRDVSPSLRDYLAAKAVEVDGEVAS